MTTRRWLLLALVVVAILLIVGRALAGMYSEYLWYDALGASALWRTRLTAITAVRVGSGAAAALFAFANLYAVRHSVVSLVFPRRLGNLEIGEEVSNRYLIGAAAVLSVCLGLVLTLPENTWTSLVLARSGRLFGETDPYLDRDLGFFVYWLPFENALWTWAFVTVVVVSVGVILLYALTPSLKWQRSALYASTYVRRHFTVLIGALLLLLAWGFRLDMYSLVMEGSGPDGAFSFVDFKVGLPGDVILAVITLVAAIIVVGAGLMGQMRIAGISVFTVVAAALIIRELAPAIVQHSGTDAERVARERPYVAVRAGYTRRAFAVDAIKPADSTMAYGTVSTALPWLSAWDASMLARAVDGSRTGPTEDHDDQSSRIAWRWSANGLVADVVTPPPPGTGPRTPWTVTRAAASGGDDRGALVRLPGPRGSAAEDSPVDAPLVHPGASTFVVIPDSLNHSVGTPLDGTVSRTAHAWALQSIRILTSELPQPRPTLVSHRDVRDRLDLFMPFFAQGRSVEPLLMGDSLYWGVDLYSISGTYPLSRRMLLAGDERSYFHHAAVAIIQASTGDITVVPDSTLDPIAASWVHRLPSLFGTWSALPTGLGALLAPPTDAVYAQAGAFGRYGSRADNEIIRRLPSLDGSDTSIATADLPMLLPGTKFAAITLPLVDEADRVSGVLIGSGGSTHATFWYPLPSQGPRWTAVIDRLRSLDTVGGATREGPLVHGRIRVVPTASGAGYAQPSYRARPSAIPLLNHIALLNGDTAVSIAPGLWGTSRPSVAGADSAATQSASALYAAMRDAMRRGDWAAFGRAFDALGRAIERGGDRKR